MTTQEIKKTLKRVKAKTTNYYIIDKIVGEIVETKYEYNWEDEKETRLFTYQEQNIDYKLSYYKDKVVIIEPGRTMVKYLKDFGGNKYE